MAREYTVTALFPNPNEQYGHEILECAAFPESAALADVMRWAQHGHSITLLRTQRPIEAE